MVLNIFNLCCFLITSLFKKHNPTTMNQNPPQQSNNSVLRNWVFTSFADYFILDEKHHNVIRYCVWQKEKCPNTGRTHFQGYIELNKAVRMSGVKKIIGEAHIEPRKGTRDQARNYCMKQESRVEGPWEFPNPEAFESKQGSRNDLDEIALCIKDKGLNNAINSYPNMFVKYHKGMIALAAHEIKSKVPKWRDVNVTVFWGEAGSGKTKRAFESCGDSWFKLDYAKNSVWWDGYAGEEVIIIDDFYGWIPYSQLLNILDGYPLRLEIKGGFTYALFSKVIITSNKHPNSWYPNEGFTPALQRRLHTVIECHKPISAVAKNDVVAEVGGNTMPPTSDTPAVSVSLSDLGNFIASLSSEEKRRLAETASKKPPILKPSANKK